MMGRASRFISTPILATLGRLGGMLIPFVIAYFYGASLQTDTFFIAYTIVFFLLGVFQQVYESLLIPYLSERKKNDEATVIPFVFKILSYNLVILCFSVFLLWLFLPTLLSMTSGLSLEVSRFVSAHFVRMIPFVLLAIIVAGLNGILNTYKIFWLPAVSPLLRSIFVILVICLFHESLGIFAVSYGLVIGEAIRWIITLFLLSRVGLFKLSDLSFAKGGGHVKGFWAHSTLQVIALVGSQFVPLVNQWFATWLPEGDLSRLSYAERLFMMPIQIFLAGISQIFLSDWSDLFHEKGKKVFKEQVLSDLKKAFLLALIASFIFFVFRRLIVSMTLGFGEMSARDSEQIAYLFGWFILGLAPAIVTSLLLRVLFVLRKARLFLIQSWLKVVLQIILNILLIRSYGTVGIAMATTLTASLSALGLYLFLRPIWQEQKA